MSDLEVAVHRGIEDDGRTTWDVCLDGPVGTIEVLHTVDSEEEAARVAETERENRSK